MDNREYIAILGAEIKKIRQTAPEKSEERIAEYLRSSLKTYSSEQQLAVLDELIGRFAPDDVTAPAANVEVRPRRQATAALPLLELLGASDEEQPDLPAAELEHRIAAALETIFRQLNEITIGISASFADQPGKQPTIEKAILAYLNGTSDLDELKNHLEIVKSVFALTQQAFTQAVSNKIREIITELDPARTEGENNSGGLNFGAFQKAKKFDILQQKHQTLARWNDSGLLNEALLREFEQIYQKLYKEKRGIT